MCEDTDFVVTSKVAPFAYSSVIFLHGFCKTCGKAMESFCHAGGLGPIIHELRVNT